MIWKEAFEAMKSGKKVRHRYFSSGEWMMLGGDDQKYLFEDGVRCDAFFFWSDRTDPAWETDWEIVEENQ